MPGLQLSLLTYQLFPPPLQEARTMAANNVDLGVWHGPSRGLPIYSAAAETDAPSVPVMSAEAVKPPKV